MKTIQGLLLFVFLVNSAFSQDNFSVHFAQSYSKFKFIDSKGNEDKNLSANIRYSYGLNYNKQFSSGLFIRPELAYKNLGANSIFNNQKLDWSLHYIDFNIGAGYTLNKYKFKPYLGGAVYLSYLYKAEQSIADQYYDMLENESIKTIDFGINIYLGVKYSFSELAMIYFELRNSTGLYQIEPEIVDDHNQKLYNRAISFHFGIAFTISNSTEQE
jgi:hypothetical protein